MTDRVVLKYTIGSITYNLDVPVELEDIVRVGFQLMENEYKSMTNAQDLDVKEFEQGRRDYWTKHGFNLKPIENNTFQLDVTAEQWLKSS